MKRNVSLYAATGALVAFLATSSAFAETATIKQDPADSSQALVKGAELYVPSEGRVSVSSFIAPQPDGVVGELFLQTIQQHYADRFQNGELSVETPKDSATSGNLLDDSLSAQSLTTTLTTYDQQQVQLVQERYSSISPPGCYQPFMTGVGYYDESRIEEWLRGGPHIGAALDVTALSNLCPVAVGFMRYDLGDLPILRGFRWEWNASYQLSTSRISPSSSADFIDPSNNFPTNPPIEMSNYWDTVNVPLHISSDGRLVTGSTQYLDAATSNYQKQGFIWERSATGAQTFHVLPDLEPNGTSSASCALSSVGYSVTETALDRTIVGQGTSFPLSSLVGGRCNSDYGKAVSIAGAVGGLAINQTNGSFSYSPAVSGDGIRAVQNVLVSGRSKSSHFVTPGGGTPVQLNYYPNTLVATNRASQAHSMYMVSGSPTSALIFGQSNRGPNLLSPQDQASSAVIWNSLGNIIQTVPPSLPGFEACDMGNGECPSTLGFDGSGLQTIVGTNILPQALYLDDPCRLEQIAPAGNPRRAFIWTPATGIQDLRNYALSKFPANTSAGIAARNELAKWVGLCEAQGVYETSQVISIVGVGVRRDNTNPADLKTQGFLIHVPKVGPPPGGSPTKIAVDGLLSPDYERRISNIYP